MIFRKTWLFINKRPCMKIAEPKIYENRLIVVIGVQNLK